MPFSVPEVLAYLTSAATLEPVGTLVNHVVDEVAARLSGPATANGVHRPPSGFA
jgi:hypothetical protein